MKPKQQLTVEQKKIIDDITNEFRKINETNNQTDTFQLFDVSGIINKHNVVTKMRNDAEQQNNHWKLILLELVKSHVRKLTQDLAPLNLSAKQDTGNSSAWIRIYDPRKTIEPNNSILIRYEMVTKKLESPTELLPIPTGEFLLRVGYDSWSPSGSTIEELLPKIEKDIFRIYERSLK